MSQETAEARGRVTMRPWRVGVVVDTTAINEVREAISRLSSVWGGAYMPILDINTPTAELERLAAQYAVDSLYTDVTEGPVAELLRRPGVGWRFGGPWGPFSDDGPLRKGLLPVRALINRSTNLIQPVWDDGGPADLALAATWGLPDQVGLPMAAAPGATGLRTVSVPGLLAATSTGDPVVGILGATKALVEVQPRVYLDGHAGVYVIRPDDPVDVVEFWNMRVYGVRLVGVPACEADDAVDFLLSGLLPATAVHQGDAARPEQGVAVWGLDEASASTADAIRAAAEREGLAIWEGRSTMPRYVFQGLRTRFTRSIRVDFRPAARWVDIALPTLAVEDEPESFARGVVAADIEWHTIVGQDPRMTAKPPPFPQEASLLDYVARVDNVDHARVTDSGVALGVDAERDHARVPFALNEDAIRLLFNDDAVTATQSDVGRFQTRAAEKFGGPFTGLFNQPGARDAITLAAGRRTGVALPHLREAVSRGRGEWPDPVFGPALDAKEYGTQLVNHLLQCGVFVPALRVHCSFCRVEMYVEADEIRSTMTCEFCSQPFNLALSHSLAKPDWRYRLAAHLGPSQITALLPALAAASFLSQLRHVEEPPLAHVLGLELSVNKRTVEVDLAAYIPDRDWTLVLAEVKTSNRLLASDLDNLEFLRGKLTDAGVRCLLMFATLKEQLSADERAGLRALIERAPIVRLSNCRSVANLPLVLTGPDLSHPPGSKDHPGRWGGPSHSGLFGTALGSCRRNLGLRSYAFEHNTDGDRISCEWEE